MKKRSVPPQRWYEAMEEERKVKRNLSRLMHNFQHVPSDRFGDSLRNLVTEIEFFHTPEPGKEVRGCNRSFRHNLLNDRALNIQERIKGEKSLQVDECNKQIALASTSPRPKNAGKLTTDTNLTERRKPFSKNQMNLIDTNKNLSTINKSHHINKPKLNVSAKISSDRKQYCFDKKIVKNKLQKDSTNKERKLDLGCKLEMKNRSNEENKMTRKNRQTLNKSEGSSRYLNLNVLDKSISNVKKSNVGQTPRFGSNFGKNVSRNHKSLPTIESNKVKKLANYWNNVLNNNTDKSKSEVSSTRSSIKSCKSLECLSEEILSTSTVNIKSRNMSETDMSTLTKIEKETRDCIRNTEYEEEGEISNQSLTEETDTMTYHSNSTTLSSTSISTELNIALDQENETEKKSLKKIQQSRSNIEFVVNTKQALKTLERLLRYIQNFPSSSLLSDEIRLPRSVKVMISLLTATLSCDQYEQLWVEVSEFELTLTHSERPNSGDDKVLSPVLSNQGGSGDCFSPQSECASTLVLPNENLIRVSNALKFISLCKEVLWTMYISSPDLWQSRQARTFSFVYEETILLQETDSDYSKDSEEEEEVSIKDLLVAATNKLGELTDSCLRRFQDIWPNSIESTVRTIYYTIVSTLVWWVIFKEIWYAK